MAWRFHQVALIGFNDIPIEYAFYFSADDEESVLNVVSVSYGVGGLIARRWFAMSLSIGPSIVVDPFLFCGDADTVLVKIFPCNIPRLGTNLLFHGVSTDRHGWDSRTRFMVGSDLTGKWSKTGGCYDPYQDCVRG